MSKPEVFIIESLDFADEQKKRFEGRIISDILSLSGKQCIYYYIRTKRELKKILALFSSSNYRYLHLSCHGNRSSLHTTLDPISFQEFGKLIAPHLDKRRLFVSACSAINSQFADTVMPNSGCRSILGPTRKVGFNDAAILWASFYHVMFSADSTAMKSGSIKIKAQEISNMYQVGLTLVDRRKGKSASYHLQEIYPKPIPD